MIQKLTISDAVIIIKGKYTGTVAAITAIDRAFHYSHLLTLYSGKQVWMPRNEITKYCKHKLNLLLSGKKLDA